MGSGHPNGCAHWARWGRWWLGCALLVLQGLQGCGDPHDVRMHEGHAVKLWREEEHLPSFLETHQEELARLAWRFFRFMKSL